MDNFEKVIKEKLSQSRTMEGVDSEVLWNAIADAAPQSAQPANKSRFNFLRLTVVLAFITLPVTYFLVTKTPPTEKVSITTNQIEKPIVADSLEERKGMRSQKENAKEIEQLVSLSVTKDEEKLVNNSGVETKAESILPIEVKRKTLKRELNSELIKNTNGVNAKVASSSEMEKKANNTGSYPIESKQPIHEEIKTQRDVSTTSMPLVQRLEEHVESEVMPLNMLVSLPAPLFSIQQTAELRLDTMKKYHSQVAKKSISLRCYAGGVWVQDQYTKTASGLSDSLSVNLSPEVGYTIGGTIRIRKGRNWDITSGLEYATWKDRFDKIIYSDTLVQLNQADVLAQNIRTIEHYNTASMVTLPVHFGIHKDFSCFRLGMQIGASYSLLLAQRGRMMGSNTTVVNYNQSSKRYSNFMSLRFAPSIGYLLNEKLLLDVTLNVGLQKHSPTSLIHLTSRSVSVMPTIGLTRNY